ncbi:ATP-binding protein [Nocardiopsis quinghaiensis]|uniref:ATP-binding protein n=1 Tax=Nocardiopsis quinghaiensis TaxID=464995 RepID=UPI001239D578|nr:ATP-binding protein [Nocardiopsis quinghaiensis]
MDGVVCSWVRPRPVDVGLARGLVDHALVAAGVGEAGRAAARLAVSEAFTNALVHGRPEVGVEVWSKPGHCAVIEVYDTEATVPVFPQTWELADAVAEHGRGLGLIQAFTREVCGAYRCGEGKRVWFAVAPDGGEIDADAVRCLVDERARRKADGASSTAA